LLFGFLIFLNTRKESQVDMSGRVSLSVMIGRVSIIIRV
jgi:hypothetical protein